MAAGSPFEVDGSLDPFKTLGIERTATQADVDRAHRRLMHSCHPDAAGGSEERFRAVQVAYGLIGTPGKRQAFLSGTSTRPATRPSSPGASPTATPVARPPREPVQPVVNERLRKLLAQTEDVREKLQAPAPPASPSTADVRTGTGRRAVDDALQRSRSGDPEPPPRSRPGVRPASDPVALRHYAKGVADQIVADAHGDMRTGDSLAVGPGYTWRRVLYRRPGDAQTYRSITPLLCRGNEVLAEVDLAPGQNLEPASPVAVSRFLDEKELLAGMAQKLSNQRSLAADMAVELRAMMGPSTVVTVDGITFRQVVLDFQTPKGTTKKTVLCMGNEILELQPGDPATGGYRYAGLASVMRFTDSYIAVRRETVQMARREGRPVPNVSGDTIRNGVGYISEKILRALGE